MTLQLDLTNLCSFPYFPFDTPDAVNEGHRYKQTVAAEWQYYIEYYHMWHDIKVHRSYEHFGASSIIYTHKLGVVKWHVWRPLIAAMPATPYMPGMPLHICDVICGGHNRHGQLRHRSGAAGSPGSFHPQRYCCSRPSDSVLSEARAGCCICWRLFLFSGHAVSSLLLRTIIEFENFWICRFIILSSARVYSKIILFLTFL